MLAALHRHGHHLQVVSYALSPVNYVLGVEDQPKDGGAAARRFVAQFEAEVRLELANGACQRWVDSRQIFVRMDIAPVSVICETLEVKTTS